ncbi:D-alanyl-D-alanine carboxypeptidase family protein [Psychrobacter sp. BF1]|uniref:D-alanyl-D-alanine carboxypeptidase family protein n=1 Tax=Psychrobacter sp. BF1 TaxID=2821147 RepID=UPI001C4DFBA1|nr:serine hydrolase [Psychrobacter sp. BF1]
MQSIYTNAAISVESFTLNSSEISNQSFITSIRPTTTKMMASLAKLMTVMLAWDKIKQDNLDPAVTLIEMPVDLLRESSDYYKFYKKGEKISLSTLIQSTLIASSNEAAYALACWHSGSESYFIPQMIRKSHMLGLTNSHYTSCSGLERSAYTTAQDMSKLAKVFVSKYTTLASYCSLKYFEFNGKKVSNTNKLLLSHAAVIGLKTGNLVGIGSNLINCWIDEDVHYISIVLGAESQESCYELSKRIMHNYASLTASES